MFRITSMDYIARIDGVVVSQGRMGIENAALMLVTFMLLFLLLLWVWSIF